MKILITSAGRRVSLVRSFQNELKKIDSNGKVYATDSNPNLSAACQVADGFFKVPELKEANYIDELLGYCKLKDINLVIPTIDTELVILAKNKNRFEEQNIKVIVSDIDFVTICRDKRKTHEFFSQHAINVAKEYDKNNYTLPVYIKPVDGSRSVDNFLIKTKDVFTNSHFENEKLMFLEYLSHDIYDEFTCDLYYGKDHKLKCVVPRKRLEVRSGEVYKALTVHNSLVDCIKKNLSYIDGVIGCVTSQFFLHKEDKDKIFGIELNPRFGGGYPLTYLAGANYSKWILEEYLLNKTIDEQFDVWEKDLLMIRYDDEILIHGYKS